MRYSGYLLSTNYGWIKAILLELSIEASDFEGKFFDFDWNVVVRFKNWMSACFMFWRR